MSSADCPLKRPSLDAASSSSCKRAKPAATVGVSPDIEEELEDDVLLSWLTLDEQDVAQLMDFLSPSPPPSAPASPLSKVRFSSFITIDLNEESCGSSFSEFESSVMASFDRSGNSVEGAWVAASPDTAFWWSGTGVLSAGEAATVTSGTDAPEMPRDRDGDGF